LISPFGFKIILKSTTDVLNSEVWLRVVIKFVRFSFTIHVSPELDIVPDELNKEMRETELKLESISFFDSGLKEGRVGFFCSDCKDVKWSSIQL